MHHFFEAITNTAGDSLIGYFARVINRMTQNTVPLSSDENGTPIVVVSGVENMAKTDDYGNLSLYVEPGTYHLDIYAPNTTTFLFRVSDVAMNSTKGDAGPAGPAGDPGNGLTDTYTQNATGAVARTGVAALRETISAFGMGSVGTATGDEVTNLQKLFTACAINSNGVSRTGFINEGRYNLGDSIKFPNNTAQVGNGQDATRIFGNPAKPVLENGDPAGLNFHELSRVQLNGGTHGIKVTGPTDGLKWNYMSILNATVAGIEFTGFWQTSTFTDLRIAASPFGIKSNTTIANNIVLVRPDITGCETAIYLRGSEDFTVIGARVEGGGHATKATLDFVGCHALQFIGGYFEGGSLTLLKARTSRVLFLGTHFTFQQAGVSYNWDIDTATVLTFRNCHSTIPMIVPAGSIVENCENITVASTYTSAAVDGDNINRSTATPLLGSYWRESSGWVRFHIEIQLNGGGPGFLKVNLPPLAIAQTASVQAYNSTQLRPLGALANQGDAKVYVTNATGFPGTSNDIIVIDGMYRTT